MALSKSITDTAEVFKALGDPTRLKILKLISAMGNNLCVGIIAQKLNVSQPAVSQHLKILKNAGLVNADRQGFHVHYQITKGSLETYGINTGNFLKSFGSEMNLDAGCHSKGDTENCNKLNGGSHENP